MDDQQLQHFRDFFLNSYEDFNCFESRLARAVGLSLPQSRALFLAGRMENPCMKELALRLELTTGTVTVMINRLEKMKLVQRQSDTKDARVFRVLLTDEGQKVYRFQEQNITSYLKRMLEGLSQTLVTQLEELSTQV